MSEDTTLPPNVRISRETYSLGWVAIRSLDPRGLDRQLRDAGWSIHSLETSVEMGAFGFASDDRFNRAMQGAIRHATKHRCNCVEFDQMTEKSILGIPYTSISVHARHMEEVARNPANPIQTK